MVQPQLESRFSARSYFDNIDLLRGMAASAVMLYHIVVIGNFTTFPNWGPFEIVRNGWMGVDLFFVISGFVITLSLSRENLSTPRRARLNFMTRRWFRIAPLYYFTIIVFITFLQPHLIFLSGKSIAAHFGSHLVFLHNLLPQTHGSIVGPNWTIALEMQFYLFMALLITQIFSWKKTKLIFTFILVAWIWRFSTTLFLKPGESNANNQSIFSQMLPGTLDEFLVGILVARLWIESKDINGKYKERFEKRLFNCGVYFSIFIVTFIVNINFLRSVNYWAETSMIVFFRTSLAISFGFLLMAFITLPNWRFKFDTPFKYLGKISYGIYLWHIIVLSTILDRMPWVSGYKLIIVVTGLTVVLSIASYHLIEKPMIAKGYSIIKTRKIDDGE